MMLLMTSDSVYHSFEILFLRELVFVLLRQRCDYIILNSMQQDVFEIGGFEVETPEE